ncbi:hypothetical protein A2W14_03995 [Candidatus Gottesmanbacteria bacterium RBG_16_37_8]|uniref:TNase-like domain-containing protein n=1 Tax=Candidatus Gottesmanbacteria bacterium RBG_16_37_8 TaxID=1798371 RepID=A0A1F5YUE8_9BACT|nr:MAG: hypothetical protein A2W14_03995 [Candidatus Gottesmanbacteria bacterium RBG_16_37_8]
MKIATFTLTALGLTAGTYFLLSSNKSKPMPVPFYTVARVIDGDTFVTEEKQNIRISSTEAPELEQCGGLEAKKALEKLILGKPVYLKVLFLDPYRRFISLVYTPDSFVNEEMLKGGYSYYYRTSPGSIGEILNKAGDEARNNKRGVYSQKCTQRKNAANPSCSIKGNTRNGKIYYVPQCGFYDQVEVQLYLGDRWFCTEKEAIKSGFRAPSQCP